jgi:ribosome-associated heat shock protein Hsp15
MSHDSPDDRVRIDKWLWAARFYKTRSLATEAVAGGKVHVNREDAKPAKLVRIGDTIGVRIAPYEHTVVVTALGERRGSVAAAQALYTETADSKAARERLAEQHRLGRMGVADDDAGRPSKRDRREFDRFRGR